ncbi:Uncharacterized protein Rs2_37719 [Raphanus sativus]|nr:Uncharacterized protein Rs2_37719 [Raphanus sativus]
MEESKKNPIVSITYTSPANNFSMGHQWVKATKGLSKFGIHCGLHRPCSCADYPLILFKRLILICTRQFRKFIMVAPESSFYDFRRTLPAPQDEESGYELLAYYHDTIWKGLP